MEILKNRISKGALKKLAQNTFGDMIKAVVDADRQLVALDAELHSDLEAMLIKNGSKQSSLWGINLYPEIEDDDFIEFAAAINMRPSNGNTSRSVDSQKTRDIIITIVNKWIK